MPVLKLTTSDRYTSTVATLYVSPTEDSLDYIRVGYGARRGRHHCRANNTLSNRP